MKIIDRVACGGMPVAFGSLLIQKGASLAHVKDQMGHSSIQITVDTYGHLIPGADVAWVDRLDEPTSPQPSATQAQPDENIDLPENVEVIEIIGEPGRTRTCNPLLIPETLCSWFCKHFLASCNGFSRCLAGFCS
jgi:hypothetical protein